MSRESVPRSEIKFTSSNKQLSARATQTNRFTSKAPLSKTLKLQAFHPTWHQRFLIFSARMLRTTFTPSVRIQTPIVSRAANCSYFESKTASNLRVAYDGSSAKTQKFSDHSTTLLNQKPIGYNHFSGCLPLGNCISCNFPKKIPTIEA